MKNHFRLFAFFAAVMFAFAACSDDGGGEQEISPNTYTIVFNPNGGSIQNPVQSVTAGEISLVPAATLGLTRSGYVFKGWASSSDAASAEYLDGGKITVYKDIMLFAIWESVPAGSVVVTFNTNGGNAIEQKIIQSGETVTAPANPTKSGYIFAGWYSNSELTTTFVFTTPITADITLYAKWTAIAVAPEETNYYVRFDTANLADKISAVAKQPGEKFTESDLTTPSNIKNNYTFVGWYFDSSYTKSFTEFTVEEGDVWLYAKFKDSSGTEVTVYKISYVNGAPNADNSETTTSGYITSTNDRMTRGTTRGWDGHLFDGWFYDSAYTKPVLRGDKITQDTTFYAKWISTDSIEVGSSAIFGGLTYDKVSSSKWYTRTSSEVSGEYSYTEVSDFGTNATYFLKNGVQIINGALLWVESIGDAARAKVYSGKTEERGPWLGNSDTLTLSNEIVQISELRQYIMFKATGAGTVTATLRNATSSSCTTTKAVVVLLDKDGKILASQNLDNRPTSIGGIGETPYTLTGTVSEAGNVYLAFFRNGDDGGGIYVQSVGLSAQSDTSFTPPDLGSFTAGTSQNFAGRTYDELATTKWYTRSEKDADGNHTYTQVDSFADNTQYYLDSGIQNIGDAVVWTENRSYLYVSVSGGVSEKRGLRINNGKGNISLTAATVSDITAFGSFVMITATKSGTVVAHVWNATSNSVTDEPHAVAALVDSKGNIIDAQLIDDKKDTTRTQYTLSGEVPAGNVYLVFTRNDDKGGGLWVQDMGVYTDSVVSYNTEWESVSSKTAKSGLITSDIDVTGNGITRGRKGYFFGGWFYDRDYTKPVLRGQRISQNTTFYAKWIPVSEVVSYASASELWDVYISASDWYNQTYDKNGNEICTATNSFSFKPNPYVMGAGIKTIRNVVAYSEGTTGAVSAIITPGKLTYAGILLDQNNKALPADAEVVDLYSQSCFIAVTATSAGKIGVTVCNIPSIDCTTTNAVVALVDKNGKVLAKQTLDNRGADGADYRYCFPKHEFCVNESHTSEFAYESVPVYYRLEASVEAEGNVYVVFDRNGDGGGMIRVTDIQFSGDDSDITEEPTKDDGNASSAEDDTKEKE